MGIENVTPRGFVAGVSVANKDAESFKAVENLYFKMIARPAIINTIDYQRELIMTAYKAFSDNLRCKDGCVFNNWYKTQFSSPYLSDLHRGFLLDMLNFMMGRPRTYDCDTWDSLLTREEVASSLKMDNTIEFQFFGISSPGVYRQPVTIALPTVINHYFSKPNGIKELVYTLYILFCKRHQN